MKMRKVIIFLAAVPLLASCMRKETPPDILVPEFMDVKYDFGTFMENRYAILSATLNTDNGVKDAGFMIGYDEASLTYRRAEVKDLQISSVLNFLEYDTEYCFYAKATNGMNEIRTRLVRFRTPKKGEAFVPEPDNPDGPDDTGNTGSGGNTGTGDGGNTGTGDGGNTGTGDGGNTGTPTEPVTPMLPPEGVGITVSDSNFLKYLLGLCDEDNDGVILAGEAATVEDIAICTDNIRTIDGIQYFTSLKTLSTDGSVWNGKLTSVSLEYNGRLERFSCRHNHIKSLQLPPSLIELDMRFNNVTAPDFSRLENLKKLDCFGNGMTHLNLAPLKALEELVCGMNSFETLDVSGNPCLTLLDLSDSPYLKTVYVARGQKIKTIIAENSIDFKYKE